MCFYFSISIGEAIDISIRKFYNCIFRFKGLLFWRISYAKNKKVCCNICGWRGVSFCHKHCWYWHIYKYSTCPYCWSQPRHRWFFFYLNLTLPRDKPISFLHFAPEKYLSELISKYKNISYLSVDIDPKKAMRAEDITCLSFPDESFDFVLCSHVLEHVDDDVKAIAEIHRILRNKWVAILDVPIDYSLQITYEDSSISTPKARTIAFLQKDHVRLYGSDFPIKVSQSWLKVEKYDFVSFLWKIDANYFWFPDSPIYICRK